MSGFLRSVLLFALSASVLVFPTVTFAQTLTEEEQRGRRDLIQRAQQASVAGQHAESLGLLERAGQLLMTPSLRRVIAIEQRALQRFAHALGSAQLCIHEAQTATPRDTTSEEVCTRMVSELSNRVGRILLRPPSPAPEGLELRVGNTVLNRAFWGTPYAVDPGLLRVQATAPNHPPFTEEVTITAGQTTAVTVQFTTAQPAERDRVVEPAPRNNVGPWVLSGVGLALGGVGAGLLGFVASESATLFANNRQFCAPMGAVFECREAARERYQTAEAMQWTGVGLLAGGGALLTGGLLWLALAPRRAPVVTMLHPGAVGLQVHRSF